MNKCTILATFILFSLLQINAADASLIYTSWKNQGVDEEYNYDNLQRVGDETNPTDDEDQEEDIDEDDDDNIPELEHFDYDQEGLVLDNKSDDADDDQDSGYEDDIDEAEEEDDDDIDEASLIHNGWVIVEKSDADGYDE